jgi:hypothetical protein
MFKLRYWKCNYKNGIMNNIEQLRYYLAKHGFNVSTRLADKFGLQVNQLRLFFIYASFFTLGIPFIIYLWLAFTLKIKDFFIQKRPSVFDL